MCIRDSGVVDPVSDIGVIDLELIMADTETLNKRLQAVAKNARIKADDEAVLMQSLLERLLPHLSAGKPARTLDLSEAEHNLVKELHLLTMKPVLYVLNKKQDAQNLDENKDERWTDLLDFFTATDSDYVVVDARVEEELKDLSEADKMEFRREYNVLDSGVNALIKQCYHTLGLILSLIHISEPTRPY